MKNRCFWIMVLEKTLESPLDCKEIKPVNSKGNQLWIFTGRTDAEAEAPILWPLDSKNWLIRKDSYARKDWGQEEKRGTEDEMVGWHHLLNGQELSKLWEIAKDREAWSAAANAAAKSWICFREWTTTICCWNKVSPKEWPGTKEMYCLTTLEVESPKLSCGQGHGPSEGSGEGYPRPVSWLLMGPWLGQHHPNPCVWFCVQIAPFYKDTSPIGLGPYAFLGWDHSNLPWFQSPYFPIRYCPEVWSWRLIRTTAC